MKTELLKQLLTQAYVAGFESSNDNYNGCYPYDISELDETTKSDWLRDMECYVSNMIETIKQPKQEPAAWRLKDGYGYWVTCYEKGQADSYIKIGWELIDVLYTSPQPQQQPEPVAWRTFDGEGGYEFRDYNMNERYADEWAKRNPNHKHWVEPLYTTQPQPQPQQEPVAKWESIEAMAAKRYKVVPSHDSMFYRHAVVAGEGTRQLYIGREIDCQNMATKFANAFLDGAFIMQSYANQPQRQPLTDEQIWDICCKTSSIDFYLNFARAIEAHHGIKVKHEQ